MDKLKLLNKKIEEKNISKFYHTLPEGRKGTTIEIQNHYGIFIDKAQNQTEYEEFCTTAHEYGHCVTGSTHKVSSKYDLIQKHEYKANRRAVTEFLPYRQIQRAIKKGCTEVWQIAEFLDLPQEFIILAFKHYQVMLNKNSI